MSLPILSSNTIQAMVTPWCTYMGQQAYDNTNLAPLLSMPKIQDVTCDVVAGKTSNSGYTLEGTTYQSKYDPNWYICFTSSTEAVIFSSKYSHTKITFSYPILQVIDEDLDNIYFLGASNLHTTSNTYCAVFTLNKASCVMNYSTFPTTRSSKYVFNYQFVGKSQDGFLFMYPSSDYDATSLLYSYLYYNKSSNTFTKIREYTISSSSTYNFGVVKPSVIVNNYVYGVSTGGSSAASNIIPYFFKLDTNSSTIYKAASYSPDVRITIDHDKSFGQILTTTDTEGKVYISMYLNRVTTDQGGLFVYSTEGWSSNSTPTIFCIQNIPTSHLAIIDEENIIVGDGSTISRLQWNKNTVKWDIKSSYNPGMRYNYFSLDSSNRLWVRGNNNIIRILPGQGVNLMSSFEKDIYTWEGQNINTTMTLSVLDQLGLPVTTDQKVHLYGNVTFEDGSQTKVISFNKSSSLTVPIIVTGTGNIDCLLEF